MFGPAPSILLPRLPPFLHRLEVALRHWMACSTAKVIRESARCHLLMVGYCRRADGSTKFGGIMTFERLLELSPERARREICGAMMSLQGGGPQSNEQSIDGALSDVYSFVETRRSPLDWKTRPKLA